MSEETFIERVFRSAIYWIVTMIALASFLLALYNIIKDLSLTLDITTVFFIVIVMILLRSLQSGLTAIERRIIRGFENLIIEIGKLSGGRSSNPERKEERREEIMTSGGGAFAGMVIGGAIGLLFGPVGVVIGGIIGAILGNQAEYEAIKAERERRMKKEVAAKR